MEEGFEGIIPSAMKATTVEYNPDKFWKENTIESIFKDLHEASERERKWKKETGWKQQYMISVGEAKTANLYHLEWLCKTYNCIGGSESNKVLRQRQIIINYERSSR